MRLCGGCQSKVPDDVKGLCSTCKAERNESSSDNIKSNVAVRHDGAYDEQLDALRKDRRWRERVRPRIAKRDPMCKMCDIAITEIIDHVVPAAEAIRQARESGRWPLDKFVGYFFESNLQGLCRSCHGRKTAEDKAHTGAWPDVVAKHLAQPRKIWSF